MAAVELVVESDQTQVVLQTALSPAGGPEFTDTAFETISALRAVKQTANGLELYDPAAGYGAAGVAKTAAGAGNAVTVQTSGPMTVSGAGLTPGAWYYASASGVLTSTQPTTGIVVPIGYAADTDVFVVQIGPPIELV